MRETILRRLVAHPDLVRKHVNGPIIDEILALYQKRDPSGIDELANAIRVVTSNVEAMRNDVVENKQEQSRLANHMKRSEKRKRQIDNTLRLDMTSIYETFVQIVGGPEESIEFLHGGRDEIEFLKEIVTQPKRFQRSARKHVHADRIMDILYQITQLVNAHSVQAEKLDTERETLLEELTFHEMKAREIRAMLVSETTKLETIQSHMDVERKLTSALDRLLSIFNASEVEFNAWLRDMSRERESRVSILPSIKLW